MQHPSTLLLGLILASTAGAQIGIGRIKPDNLPGDAVLPNGAFNVTQAILNSSFGDDGSGMNDFRGVVRLPNGHYLLSHGPNGGPPNGRPHEYFELDSDGTYITNIDQPFLTGANGDFGLTDLSWDKLSGPNSRIWAGRAKAIMSYDWQIQAFDDTIIPGSANGLHLLSSFQGADVRCTTIGQKDGLQIIVTGDNNRGPNGQLDTAGVNYHVMGLPVSDFPTWQPSTPSFTGILGAFDLGKNGAAWDTIRDTIWWQMDNRSENPNPNRSGTRFIEMDLDGTLTGKIIQGAREIGGRALGCDMYIDAQGNRVLAYLVDAGSGGDNPLGLPSGEDILIEMYAGFQFGGTCGGDISYQTEPYIGNLDWTVTLQNAPANPLSVAFLFRGRPAAPPGLTLPGLINCGLLLELSSLISQGGNIPLVNGEASFIRQLPNDTGLIGAEATFQWLLPTSLTVLPLNLSDAGAFMVGSNL